MMAPLSLIPFPRDAIAETGRQFGLLALNYIAVVHRQQRRRLPLIVKTATCEAVTGMQVQVARPPAAALARGGVVCRHCPLRQAVAADLDAADVRFKCAQS